MEKLTLRERIAFRLVLGLKVSKSKHSSYPNSIFYELRKGEKRVGELEMWKGARDKTLEEIAELSRR